MTLKGVGRKVSDILMNFNFGGETIAVDTHVQRLLNRLGVVETKDSKKTADIINEITPKKYKKHAHEWLIQHGGNICVARSPKCKECVVYDLCEYDHKTSWVNHPESKAKVLYKLTAKGIDLVPIMIEINLWAEKHFSISAEQKSILIEVKKDKEGFVKKSMQGLKKGISKGSESRN